MTNRRMLIGGLVLALLWVTGCSASPKVRIQSPHDGFAVMPEGKTAVLRVSARPPGTGVSYKFVWGIVEPANARAQFADLLAYFARQEGGLEVIPPARVSARLKAAGLEPTLNPTAAQIEAFADILGCTSYLSAQVETWRYAYQFTSQKATVRFVLSCHRPGVEEPLWTANVRHCARGKSEREAAMEAMKETFRTLRRAERER